MSKFEETEAEFAPMTRAFLMIQVIGQTSVNFLNKKKLAKELEEHLAVLNDEERLESFAEFYVDSCMNSRSYRTTFFGTIPMSDEGAATRIASDINEVTGIIPDKFGLGDAAEHIRNALLTAYRNKIRGADKILAELGIEEM